MRVALHLALLVAGALVTTDPSNARGHPNVVDESTKRALGLDVHLEQGQTLFAEQCAGCHGLSALGRPDQGIPSLAGQRFTYLVRQIANFYGKEREGAIMQHVVQSRALEQGQSWTDIAGYLSRLPPNAHTQTGGGVHEALGRGIFHEQCAPCHGADAGGDREGYVPSLRGQSYPYLVGELHRLAEGSRHNMDEDLVRFLRSLDKKDIEGVADYLSRLRGSVRGHETMRPNGSVVD